MNLLGKEIGVLKLFINNLLIIYVLLLGTVVAQQPVPMVSSEVQYLQEQILQLRQAMFEYDRMIAQQNVDMQKLRGDLELLEYKLEQLKIPTPEPVIPVLSSGSDELYQQAQDSFAQENFSTAIEQLRQFLAEYPDNEQAATAQYTLAKSYYKQADFVSALVNFERVIEIYPNHQLRPQAELELAYCYYELKDFAQAKILLQQLQENYPQHEVAELAAQKLAFIDKN